MHIWSPSGVLADSVEEGILACAHSRGHPQRSCRYEPHGFAYAYIWTSLPFVEPNPFRAQNPTPTPSKKRYHVSQAFASHHMTTLPRHTHPPHLLSHSSLNLSLRMLFAILISLISGPTKGRYIFRPICQSEDAQFGHYRLRSFLVRLDLRAVR